MPDNIVEYDVRLRAAGKTRDLLDWWRERPRSRVIVVPDQQQAKLVRKSIEGQRTTEELLQLINFDDLRSGRLLRGRGDVEVGIDNLDMILNRLLPPNALLRRVASFGVPADSMLLAMRDG
jgi:hypothetical protein